MNLFYTPDIESGTRTYVLDEAESRHAAGVLRLGVGDGLHLTNGRGDMFECRIVSGGSRGARGESCVVEVVSEVRNYGQRDYRLHVAMAPTKNIDRYEWFLEKVTEVGVDRVTPVITQRSERRVVKRDRSEKVVCSAAKQSLKAYMPAVDELQEFRDFVARDFGDGAAKFIAYCSSEFEKLDFRSVAGQARDVVMLIGPEGDFTPQEVALAVEHGFRPVTLGPSRLRTETAGVVVATFMLL